MEKIINGRSVPTREGGFPVLKLNAIRDGHIDPSVTKEGDWSASDAEPYVLRSGDFLLSRGNGTLSLVGRGGLVEETCQAAFPDTMMRIRVNQDLVVPKYFCLVWNGPLVRQEIESSARTTAGIYKINQGILREIPVPLPPLTEQFRIVEFLESNLSRLELSKDILKSASMGCEMMQEASLQEELRRVSVRTLPLFDLLHEKIINGRSVQTRKGGFPVLRLNSIHDYGIDFSISKEGAWSEEEARPFLVRSGDFLLSRGSGTLSLVGRGALVCGDPGLVAFPDTMMRIRVSSEVVDPSYFSLVWNSRYVRRQIESYARTTAGIYKVNQALLKKVEVPVPSLEDQRNIVKRVHDVSNGTSHLKESLAVLRRRAEHLLRALLNTAFTGKLVPQDPSDEPADSLLEQTRAERTSVSTPKRARRVTTKTPVCLPPATDVRAPEDPQPVHAGEQTALEF